MGVNKGITRRRLYSLFAEYNKLYFGNRLKRPDIYLLMKKRPYGRCCRGTRDGQKIVDIWISKYIEEEEFLQMTLLHEMIHQYVYEVLKGPTYTIIPHGLRFHLMRLYLNHKYKLKICPN